MIIDEGMNIVRDLIDGDVDKGQFGTGDTPETAQDKAIESGVAATQKVVTSTTTSKQISWLMGILSTEGVGNDLTEFVIQESSTPITYTRDVFTILEKTNLFEMRGKKRIFMDKIQ